MLQKTNVENCDYQLWENLQQSLCSSNHHCEVKYRYKIKVPKPFRSFPSHPKGSPREIKGNGHSITLNRLWLPFHPFACMYRYVRREKLSTTQLGLDGPTACDWLGFHPLAKCLSWWFPAKARSYLRLISDIISVCHCACRCLHTVDAVGWKRSISCFIGIAPAGLLGMSGVKSYLWDAFPLHVCLNWRVNLVNVVFFLHFRL